MTTSVKINCKCHGPAAEFQDKQYGKGVRIATVSQKSKDKVREVRCTVCGAKQQRNVG